LQCEADSIVFGGGGYHTVTDQEFVIYYLRNAVSVTGIPELLVLGAHGLLIFQ
jgi:hypothetical protein